MRGDSRGQGTLFPVSLDELVPEDHVCRVIDAFVESLEMAELGFGKARPAGTGRPPYDPADLLKLYRYGYLHQVRSSRRLERECQRNLELWWLLGRLAPDFKTIADFRRDNGAAIVASGRAFVVFCQGQGLLGQRLALDGTKIKSAGSRDRSFTAGQLAEEQQRLEAYLSTLEQADAADTEAPVRAERVRAALTELAAAAQVLSKEQRNTLCVSDPDAQLMRSGRAGIIAGYNLQASVDQRSGVVVHHAVTQQAGDNQQLLPMAAASQALLQAESLEVVADAGYSNGAQLQACEDQGIQPLVAVNRAINNQGNYFDKAHFAYDAERDVYRCPAGETLVHKTYSSKDKIHLYHREDCTGCALKDRCTASGGRWVSRHFHEEAFERSRQRLADDPDAMTRRMATAEPVFGTLKRRMGEGGRCRCWGLGGVSSEIGLHVLAHNLQRVINLAGPRWLIGALAN